MVLWDNGFCNNYHAGRSNLYDLRVLDTGPSGIVHENVLCAGCSADRIFGMGWTCNQCLSVHLCSRCYHLKYHDLTHEFVRYLVPGGHGVVVPCRAASQTPTEIHGIFRSAVVVRGQDWKWGDQDGGVGSQGLVKEIANWKDLTGNSVACVIWHGSKAENLYRVGHDSKVDVRCIKPGSGGKIYTTHLPLLGKPVDSVQTFKIGQTVEVCVDLPTLIQLQAGHGEYRPEMSVVVGRKGRVHRITEKGDVRVQFASALGSDAKFSRWTVNPMALKSVKVFAVGEQVTLTNDKSLIARYHTNHAVMSGYSGLTARIQLLHSESSATVDLGHGRVITVHPAILEHIQRQQENVPTQNMNERFMSLACSGDVMEVEKILSNPLLIPDNNALLIALHKAANLGLLAVVSSIVRFRPVLVNQKLEQKTVLMVAAYQGYVEILRTILSSGGDGSIPDQTGDLPIHYAAIGSKPATVLTLIDRGSPINSQNNEGRTPLHQAVIGRSMETLIALLKAGAAVNIQDKNGETPLQVAINMKNEDTASQMVDQADLLVFENNGWNSLHLAVRAGLPKLVEQLIQTDRRCVNIVTRDRQAPLHIAVASENLDVIKCLLKTPECDINIQDDQSRSGLHYAALNANSSVLLLLLEHRSDISLQDRDGNTAAHLAVIGTQGIGDTENRYNNDLEAVFDPVHIDRLTQMEVPSGQILRVGLMLMLFHHGADRDTRNLAGETPINLVENCELQQFIVDYLVRPAAAEPVGAEPDYAEIQENIDAGPHGAGGIVEEGVEADPGMAVEKECRICSEQTDLMTFHPCQHKLVCRACCIRMKKCFLCNSVIDKKTVESATTNKKDVADIQFLEKKVQDLEDQFLCGICMERKRNVAFLCGHGACQP